jgi:hypothetical protein
MRVRVGLVIASGFLVGFGLARALPTILVGAEVVRESLAVTGGMAPVCPGVEPADVVPRNPLRMPKPPVAAALAEHRGAELRRLPSARDSDPIE